MAVEAKEDDLGNNKHTLSPLFHKAHELIYVIQLNEKKRKQNNRINSAGKSRAASLCSFFQPVMRSVMSGANESDFRFSSKCYFDCGIRMCRAEP